MQKQRQTIAGALVVLAVVASVLAIRSGLDQSTEALTTIPTVEVPTTPAPEETTTTTDPGPTDQQIIDYVTVLEANKQWDFVKAWWEADLTTYVNALRAAQQAPAPRPITWITTPKSSAPVRGPAQVSSPNGFLQCVGQRESGGSYTAVNPSSGAGGKYQFLPSTWREMGGTGSPQNASPAQQEAMAQKLYSQAGTSPWAGGQYRC